MCICLSLSVTVSGSVKEIPSLINACVCVCVRPYRYPSLYNCCPKHFWHVCAVLQCVSMRCCVLQFGAVCCRVLQNVAVWVTATVSIYLIRALCCNVRLRIAVRCSVLQRVAVCSVRRTCCPTYKQRMHTHTVRAMCCSVLLFVASVR